MLCDNIKMQLQNNPLTYREQLTIPSSENFGVEIELENIDYNKVYKLIKKQFGTTWKITKDDSLIKGANAEIVSPILQNNKQTWTLLKKLAELLKKLNPTFENCSFQINFDGTLLPTDKERLRFLKLYAYYEDIIYRFSMGEDNKYRNSLDTYASPIMLFLKGLISGSTEDEELITEMFSNNKRYGIVFKTEKNLIEFRTPNGTLNPILWQNYITFFYYLIKLSTSSKCNEKELENYIKSFSKIYLYENYSLLKEEKALSLSKQLYSHKEDQTSFLHQYTGLK